MSLRKHFADVAEAIQLQEPEAIETIIDLLRSLWAKGGTVWICGNGGSAATAAHFANDLVKMAGLRAIDVSALTPVTLAYGNDCGWDRMFVNVIKRMSAPGDVVFLISCSGNSENIVVIPEEMHLRCDVVALTGPEGGKLTELYGNGKLVSLVRVCAEDIKAQEDLHSIICHGIAGALCEM